MKKTFVFDTNVLLHDPECLHRFQDNDIVIPITVMEEMGKKGLDVFDPSKITAKRMISGDVLK